MALYYTCITASVPFFAVGSGLFILAEAAYDKARNLNRFGAYGANDLPQE